jgi:hypothetical protein
MLFERQRLLLTLLDALEAPVGNTDFQKLLLFYAQECEKAPSYEFVPYKFGGFSFTSYADKRKLTEAGLLTEDDQQWELTKAGRQMGREHGVLPLMVAQFCRRYATLRGPALIAEQYRKYPYYAARSEIVDKLSLEPEAQARIAAARPEKSEPGLCTIGYEGKSLENYLNQLLRAGVTLLCDVRRNPLSRKYGFAKSTLRKACEGVGIRYEHLPELGIASEDRRDLKAQADYDGLFATYERNDLPQQKAVLEKIGSWIEQGERVALTCYEAQPYQCHRHCVSEAVEYLTRKATAHL